MSSVLKEVDDANSRCTAPTPEPPSSVELDESRSFSSEVSSLNTASFIQAAVRSMLEKESIVSDDDEDETGQPKPDHSPSLASLRTKKLPALPDEQDRRRFVGCLAAVLASAYHYCDERDVNEGLLVAESMAYLGADDDEDDGYDSQRLHFATSSSFEHSDLGNSNPRSIRSRLSTRDDSDQVLARTRLRRRRYDVLSSLLLSSAELLQLEKSQAKAFLPMLSRILVPSPPNTSKTAQRPPLARRSNGSSRRSESHNDERSRALAAEKNVYTAPVHSFSETGSSDDFLTEQIDRIDHLRPFLDSLSPGAGFRCLSMFMLQHLLHSKDGYDARVRHAVKALGVLVLVHDMELDPVDVLAAETSPTFPASSHSQRRTRRSRMDLVALATRKFEALERGIASRLLRLSREQERMGASGRSGKGKPKSSVLSRSENASSREQLLRGLKIGGTAVVAGTLFALTGGLAAPGIAAGVAAIAGGTAVTAAAASVLTSTAAVTAIFGVGGGSLAAYKMQRRTQGLTEFEFRRETSKTLGDSANDDGTEGDLFSTIVISGWLRDEHDFQRPWGVVPWKPRISDRLELLERFYAIYRPDHVLKCRKILQSWEGEEKQLWKMIREKYGRDPDHLFPLEDGPRYKAELTLEQHEVIDELFIEMGYVEPRATQETSTRFDRILINWKKGEQPNQPHDVDCQPFRAADTQHTVTITNDSLHGPTSVASSDADRILVHKISNELDEQIPKHLATVWDYGATYGGELYSIRWESVLLTELCDSVADLAFELVSSGGAQILKHTALSTLMSAIAWPYALVNAANMIDGTWTLAVERSDEAGKELARSLLFSRAGHRPVTLVGYSFGARVVYACLKELAIQQEKWETYRQTGRVPPGEIDSSFQGRKVDFYKAMREPASIVEDAIVMGLPNHLSLSSWKSVRQIVAGRLINCFSQKDLILSLMFQFKRLGLKPVCGTCAVNVNGVENIDISDLVSGHQDYCFAIGDILKRVRHGQPFQSRPIRLFVPEVDKRPSEQSDS